MLQSVLGDEAFWDVAQLSQCDSILLWSAKEPSHCWRYPLIRTRCFEQEEAVEPHALLAPNNAAVASAASQSRTTSSSALEAAAGHPAPADRSTGAMASVLRAEQDGDPHLPELCLTVLLSP